MSLRARSVLAVAAFAIGGLAAVAGSSQPPLAGDEVAAVDLAGWLRERREKLRVLDARSADAFDAGHLPGARRLADSAASDADDTVVVYADRDVDAGVADALRRQSTARVLRLHGGLRAWNDEVLFPVLRGDASAGQRQRFEARAALSRYFGGTPRQLDPGEAAGRTRSRRGC